MSLRSKSAPMFWFALAAVLAAAALTSPPLAAAPGPPPFLFNLLVNPDAETGDLSGWTILENGGVGWGVLHGSFRTSYFWDRRQQVVDLWAHGFSPEIMAQKPPIHVSEEFQREYCPDTFYLKVSLLDANQQVLAAWHSGEQVNSGACQWGGEVWDPLTHTFRDYPEGVRYVRWEDGGKDLEFWGGHYGVKIDNARLLIHHPEPPEPETLPFRENLLVNPDAETGDLFGWTILENGGMGWGVLHGSFRTSYFWNRREQIVDLREHGFDAELMAQAPPIVVSEAFQREYCPDTFYLKAQLLDEDMQVLDAWDSGVRVNSGVCQWGGEVWDRLGHTFRDYPAGVRYVRFEDGGKDLEFWGGHHYGVKIDQAELVLLDSRHPAYWQNLLTNAHGATGDLTGWDVTESGGAGWSVTPNGPPTPDGSLAPAFQTSTGWSRRVQVVDLRDHGFSDDSMATSPLIRVWESFEAANCPADFYLKVDLLDRDGGVIASYDSNLPPLCGSGRNGWHDVFHSFVDYGPNVRYVRWEDGGRDGVKLGAARLEVFTDNLLTNGGGETGDLSGWEVTANGGAGWAVPQEWRDGIEGNRAFHTSWGWDRRVQYVDLLAKGLTATLLDEAPPIHVQERFRRFYCPDLYYLKADLLDEMGAVVASWDSGVLTNSGDCRWGEELWEEVYHVFTDYGPGVRYVRWEDGGKDNEFWAGQYGVLLDGAYLTVEDIGLHAPHHPRQRQFALQFVCGDGTGIPCPCGYEGRPVCPGLKPCGEYCHYENILQIILNRPTCETKYCPVTPYCHDGLKNEGGICRPGPIDCCDGVDLPGLQAGQGYSARVHLPGAVSVVPAASSSCQSPAVSEVHPIGRNPAPLEQPAPWRDLYPDVDLMFNANFYNVSNFDPYTHACTSPLGLTISNGQVVTPKGLALGEETESLVFFWSQDTNGLYADIVADPVSQYGLGAIRNAVSGFRLLRDGELVAQPFLISPLSKRPRTVVGLDATRQTLVVVTVNTGEDSGSGAKLTELADYLKRLGVTNALTLDGSGSAQLYHSQGLLPTVTKPSDTRPNQGVKFYRPVPVFLGFED